MRGRPAPFGQFQSFDRQGKPVTIYLRRQLDVDKASLGSGEDVLTYSDYTVSPKQPYNGRTLDTNI